MKKVWNKETRNQDSVYYRKGDWGIEVSDDWFKPNFTEVEPPQESLEDSAPCDWDADLEEWILDVVEADNIEALKELNSTDNETIRVVEDVVALLIEKSVFTMEDLPLRAQDKLIAREAARTKLKD